MKKFFALILALAMALSLVACGGGSSTDNGSGDGATTKMRFVTGGESGTYYAFGSVIAQHATNNAGIDVVGLVGNGSQSNVQELQDGNAELAFCQSDVMAYAYNGTNIFADHGKVDCFSTVAALYMEQVQIVTVDPTIKTVDDLAGKKVSVGAAGSGVYFNAKDILTAYGLGDVNENDEFTQINATYQSFGDSANDLKDGKIDAAFVVAGAPTPAITELCTTNSAYLVPIDGAVADAMMASCPFYTTYQIPAGTYPGQDEDVTTVTVKATLIVSASASEDDVYKLTAAIFDNAADIAKENGKGAELSLENATTGMTAPFHKGAAKYFAEKGITVDAQ